MEVVGATLAFADTLLGISMLVISGIKIFKWYGEDWKKTYFWLAVIATVAFDMRLHSILSHVQKITAEAPVLN